MQDRLYTLKEHVLNALSLSRFTERGKRHFILLTGGILSVIGLITGWPVFLWGGIFLTYGVFLHFWITWDRGNPCPGPRHTFLSPTGQVQVGICQGCNSWVLSVRDNEAGTGHGVKKFVDRIRQLQQTWERNVPEVAGELRTLADHFEDYKSLRPDDFKMDEFAAEYGLTSPEEQIERMAADLAETYKGGMAVLVPEEEYDEFAAWKREREGEGDGPAPGPS